MEAVTLKNGTEELKVAVITTMMTLNRLAETDPIALYELAMKAQDPQHAFWGETGERLKKFNMVSADGSMHGTVRNIVKSAVVINATGTDFSLVNPIK